MGYVSSEEYGCIMYLVFWTVILLMVVFAATHWVVTKRVAPLVIYAYHHIIDLRYRSMEEKMTFDEAENTLEKINSVRWWLFILSPARKEEIEEELHGIEIYCREIVFPVKEKDR